MNAVEKWSTVSLLASGYNQAAESVARLVSNGAVHSAAVVILTVVDGGKSDDDVAFGFSWKDHAYQ